MKKILLILFILSLFISIFTDELICDKCNQPIDSNYVQIDKHIYHSECFTCFKCNKPIESNDFYVYKNHFYCQKCYSEYISIKCNHCGKEIRGNYIKDYWGNYFHTYHKDEIIRCDYCQRLVSDNFTSLPLKTDDGFIICNKCKTSVISDRYEANKIFNELVSIMYDFDLIIPQSKIQLFLVSKDKLKSVSKLDSITKMHKGFTEYQKTVNSNNKVIKKSYKIFILKDMPELFFISALSHELMHTWIHENSTGNISSKFTEGSCNYISYLTLNFLKENPPFLKNYDNDVIDFIIYNLEKNPDKIYGDGYREVKSFVHKYSISIWLIYLRSHNKLPG
mgnify:CR=1 FL=1